MKKVLCLIVVTLNFCAVVLLQKKIHLQKIRMGT